MSERIAEMNDETFEASTRTGVYLVDFWAPWCGPCRVQLPILEQVAAAMGEKARVVKVNVDEAPKTAAAHGVRSIPTLVVLKDGQEMSQFVGVQSAGNLIRAVQVACG